MGRLQTLVSGPWKGVRNTTDPMDDPPDLLVDAQNIVIPDPIGGSGAYARPGFLLGPLGNPFALGVAGQKTYTHTTLGGTSYTFAFAGGKVYRLTTASADGTTWMSATDVTPVLPTISATARITCVSYQGNLVVSDGTNTPWYVADSGLGATPLVATKIFLDAANTNWTPLAGPAVYSGALMWVLGGSSAVGSISPGIGLTWCEPGTPGTGYNQTGYSDFWNLQQTAEGDPLVYAVAPTNTGLVYFRRRGIGRIVGNPGLGNFSTTATHDAVSADVGCIAQATVQRFGNDTLFFADATGRPWRLQPYQPPEPIWLNMRSAVDTQLLVLGQASAIASVAVAAIEPTLQIYLVAPYSPQPTASPVQPPTTMYAFDVRSGAYVGTWKIGGGMSIAALDTIRDPNNRPRLFALATNSTSWAINDTGYLWRMADPAVGGATVWQDNGTAPSIYVQTGRMGYSADTAWTFGTQGSSLVMSQAPVTVTIQTPYTPSTVAATPTPNASSDGVYRAAWGMDYGTVRGVQIKLSPTTATSQWGAQRISLEGVPSKAGPDDE